MSEWLAPYQSAIAALGGLGFFHVVQILVADVIALRRGHTPGTAAEGGHDDLLFRASRAHANTNESIAAVVLIAGFAIARGTAPGTVAFLCWAILGLRILHGACYWANWQAPRSISFALGIVALLALFGAGVRAG